jgi:hypothetical protein
MHLALSNGDVKQLLGLMGQSEPLGWIQMWKAYEIVRDAIKPGTLETLARPRRPNTPLFVPKPPGHM